MPDPERPPASRRAFLDAVAAGTAAVPIGRVYRFDQIVQAHTDMEQNGASGKLVVTTEMASDGGRSE